MEFEKVAACSTMEEATGLASILELAGIECLISTREKGWLAATDSQVFWIRVAPADFDKASHLLHLPPLENVTLLLQCPKCKSLNVTFDAWTYLPLWRKVLPPWWCKEKFSCRDCKHVWEQPPENGEACELPAEPDARGDDWICPWCHKEAVENVANTIVMTRRCSCGAIGMAWPYVDSDEMIDEAIGYFQVQVRPESRPFDQLYLEDIRRSGIEIRESPMTKDPTVPPFWSNIRHLWFRAKE